MGVNLPYNSVSPISKGLKNIHPTEIYTFVEKFWLLIRNELTNIGLVCFLRETSKLQSYFLRTK